MNFQQKCIRGDFVFSMFNFYILEIGFHFHCLSPAFPKSSSKTQVGASKPWRRDVFMGLIINKIKLRANVSQNKESG